MFIALLPCSLPVIPILLAMAVIIAAAGHYRGSEGAWSATKIIWGIAFLLQAFLSFADWAPIRSLFITAIVTTVPVALIYLPIKMSRGRDWSRGRLVRGLLGAMLAGIIHVPMTLMLVCTLGVDCL